ncbi:MAG: TetR/AcrR family transcriptional regulator [Gemmatimonadaceae bacterium]
MQSDDPTTRSAILRAAEQLFAAQGFTATSTKQIAAVARVNSALLYYYFGSKDNLYAETLEAVFGDMTEQRRRHTPVGQAPDVTLRALVQLLASFMSARPNAPRLLARELLDHGTGLSDAGSRVPEFAAGMLRQLAEVVSAGQRGGSLRAEVDPELAAISIIGQVVYWFVAQPAVSSVRSANEGKGSRTHADFSRHAADFALSALRPAPKRLFTE